MYLFNFTVNRYGICDLGCSNFGWECWYTYTSCTYPCNFHRHFRHFTVLMMEFSVTLIDWNTRIILSLSTNLMYTFRNGPSIWITLMSSFKWAVSYNYSWFWNAFILGIRRSKEHTIVLCLSHIVLRLNTYVTENSGLWIHNTRIWTFTVSGTGLRNWLVAKLIADWFDPWTFQVEPNVQRWFMS
jgi:hypothetical protein